MTSAYDMLRNRVNRKSGGRTMGLSGLDFNSPIRTKLEADVVKGLNHIDPRRATPATAKNMCVLGEVEAMRAIVLDTTVKGQAMVAQARVGMLASLNKLDVVKANTDRAITQNNGQTAKMITIADFHTGVSDAGATAAVSWMTQSTNKARDLIR